jgi:hypothetical protein
MAAINLIQGNLASESVTIPDIEAVRLIYTRKKKKMGGTISIHLKQTDLQEIIDNIAKVKDGDGVRLYIATYPDNYPGPNKYSKMDTIVAVPTYASGNFHIDCILPSKVIECRNKIDRSDSPFHDDTASDHYELCPPATNCKGTTIWDNLP